MIAAAVTKCLWAALLLFAGWLTDAAREGM
jgi:hypothetical protein